MTTTSYENSVRSAFGRICLFLQNLIAMKKKGILFLITLPLMLFSLQRKEPQLKDLNPADQLKMHYLSDLDSLVMAAETCLNTDSADAALYLKRFYSIRRSYKKTEIWADYYQPEFVQDYINGPPLPKTERNSPKVSVVEPSGLQIIEELLLEEQPDWHSIHDKMQKLTGSLRELRAFSNYTRIENRHSFEAMKLSLNRLFSLGLSGFDSPGQTQVVDEAEMAFESVKSTYIAYESLLKPEFRKRFSAICTQSEKLLANRSFVRFDRYAYLRQVINPMMELLVETQVDLGIEFQDMTATLPGAVNFRSTNLFAKDYLNIPFFSALIPSPKDDEKRLLGEKLFFDQRLSGNDKMSCASCHEPSKGFSDGKKTSTGIDGKPLQRNSPGLINAIYSKRFFWDIRAEVLQQQIEHVIVNEREFGSNYHLILQKLEKDSVYQRLFHEVYGGFAQPMNRNNILDALTKYVSSLTGFNSRFDKAVRNENVELTKDEIAGFNLFMGKAQCAICHFAPTFNGTVPPHFRDSESEVIGVPDLADKKQAKIDPDQGRMINGVPAHFVPFYEFSFKTPTVRNSTKTAPYMHNGVFKTLREVIDFYNDGGGAGRGFNLSYQTLPSDKLNLTGKEKRQLETFLRSLEEQ